MARHSRERSVRSDTPLNEGKRDVVLKESRRFFTARGNDSGVREARALQAMIGIGAELVEGKLIRDNVKGAAQATAEAAAGGERDPNNKNKGYNETFGEIEATNDLSSFSKELPALIDKEGWFDLDHEEFQSGLDSYFEGQLKGINPESAYGLKVAKGILQQNDDLVRAHSDYLNARSTQERRIMVFEATRSDYDKDGTLDHDKLMKRLQEMVPGPGGRKTYIESVFDLAEEVGDVSIIESMPENFPGGDPTGVTDPNFKDLFDVAKEKAEATFDKNKKEFEDDFKADEQTERALSHSDLTTRAKAGDATVMPDIRAGGDDGPNGEPRLLTRPQQKLLYDQIYAAQQAGDIARVDGDLFGSARAFGMSEKDYDNAASAYATKKSNQFRSENPEWNDDKVQAEVLKIIVERSFRHDLVPKYIADFLDATPANPERFQEAVNVKAMLDAYDKSLFQRTVSDRNAATMAAYEFALRDTGNPEGAMEFLSQRDPARSKGRGNEISKLALVSLDSMANDPFFSDYEITRDDKIRAEKLAKHYMELGYNDDRITDFIETGMRGRNVRVGGVLYPVDSGWIVGDEAAESFLRSEAHEFFANPEDMVMVKHPNKHGWVVYQDKNALLPYASPEVRISEIEKRYAKTQYDQLLNIAAGAESGFSEKMKEADSRAFYSAHPPSSWGKPGDRAAANKRSRAAWDNMDPEVRQRLIEAQLKNVEAKKVYRTYSDKDFDENGEFIRNPNYMSGPNAINAQAQPR